jgi:hypothetical protein
MKEFITATVVKDLHKLSAAVEYLAAVKATALAEW